jgi:Plasma-membrane choline transporter
MTSRHAGVRLLGCIIGGLVDYLISLLETFMQYMVRNAYIIVAKDGTSLMTSGKKAFNLLKNNLIDVIALNRFGDLVLFFGKFFVVLITGFVGYETLNVSCLWRSIVFVFQ